MRECREHMLQTLSGQPGIKANSNRKSKLNTAADNKKAPFFKEALFKSRVSFIDYWDRRFSSFRSLAVQPVCHLSFQLFNF